MIFNFINDSDVLGSNDFYKIKTPTKKLPFGYYKKFWTFSEIYDKILDDKELENNTEQLIILTKVEAI